jgi:MFS transporter, ACDE family, multidrug resistance protein
VTTSTAGVAGAARRPPLPLIFAITVTGITGNTIITPALPEIVAGVGARPELAGLLIAASTLPGIVLAPVIGVLADRYGRREVLVPCLALFGLAGGLAALAPNLAVLLGLRFLQGAGSAGLINLAVVLISDHWDGPERVRMLGRNSAVLTACLAILPILGGALADVGGWRAPFLGYLIGLPTAWLVARMLPPSARLDVALSDQIRGTVPLLRSWSVAGILALSAAVFMLIYGVLLTALPIYLAEGFGVGPSLRGLLLGLPAIANTAVALSIGRFQRFRRSRQLAAAAGLFAAGLAAIAGAPTLAVVVAGVVCFGAGEGLMLPNLQAAAAGVAGAAQRGTVVALYVSAARVGQTLGPVSAGAGLATIGPAGTFAVAALFAGLLVPPLLVRRRGGAGAAPA